MGDSGEGLVDAEARFQERLAEREQEKALRERTGAPADPELERAMRSLDLAKVELERQMENTQHPVRREQIRQALTEIQRRIEEAKVAPPSQ